MPLFASLLPAAAQTPTTRDSYLLGEEKRLQIVVHIIGEVQAPGEYVVSDDTDVLELVAKAGGPTEYGNLGKVHVKRRNSVATAGMTPDPAGAVLKVDLSRFLKERNAPEPPVLQPGDVVTVGRNSWRGWRTAFTMIRDVSVVVSTYLLYRRVVE
jgi:protein involved in polysaccharide export with SLBB domain